MLIAHPKILNAFLSNCCFMNRNVCIVRKLIIKISTLSMKRSYKRHLGEPSNLCNKKLNTSLNGRTWAIKIRRKKFSRQYEEKSGLLKLLEFILTQIHFKQRNTMFTTKAKHDNYMEMTIFTAQCFEMFFQRELHVYSNRVRHKLFTSEKHRFKETA